MDSHKIVIVVLLLLIACAPRYVRAVDQISDSIGNRQIQSDWEKSQNCLDLQESLQDKERSQELLRDRARIHYLLKQSELRQEMLHHPRFMRQMMRIKEMREELLQNEQMLYEMLRNRDIHREINRNREMLEEIEKNETYRQINQEQQADILEELLLQSTDSGKPSPKPLK